MVRNVTIVFDSDLFEKLKILQAKEITKSKKHVNFSRILNQVLREGLKIDSTMNR